MNRFYILWVCLVWLAVSASCAHQEVPDGGNEPTRLLITAEGLDGILSRAATEVGTEGERTCSELYIYYFRTNGTFITCQRVTPAGGSALYPLTVDAPIEVTAGKVDIIVFASPAGIVMPDRPTKTELEALRTTGMTGDGNTLLYTGNRAIPMSGKVSGISFETNKAVSINLRRSVAKLRICVNNGADPGENVTLHTDRMSLQLLNLRAKIPYLPLAAGIYTPEDIAVFDSQNFGNGGAAFVPETTAGGAATWHHIAYVGEHLFDETEPFALPDNRAALHLNVPYTIGDDGEEEQINKYRLPLDFALKRNHIYQITVNIYGPGEGPTMVNAEIDVMILPWEEIDADVIE